jgi:hypothetical protein
VKAVKPGGLVVNFSQVHSKTPKFTSKWALERGIMSAPKNDKQAEYARYAAHCLDMVTLAKDRESRAIQREMAAEWLRLADAVAHPLKRTT